MLILWLPLEPIPVGRPKLGLQLNIKVPIKVPKVVGSDQNVGSERKVPTNVPTKMTVPITVLIKYFDFNFTRLTLILWG